MELKDFIKSYNPVFNNEEKCKNFIEWIDTLEFQNSGIVDEQGNIKEDLNVRNVKSYSLNRFKYGTETHYFNLLSKIFLEIFRQYIKEVYGGSFSLNQLSEITVLKYDVGGKYDFHTDHNPLNIPRTLSLSFLLNDTYAGGQLEFLNPSTQNIMKIISPKENTVIVWPSDYKFPHAVAPITRGKRYGVVCWAV
tara:strand:- start:1160 stop:1738 length:579 start_codon:yes stop_codon:yes gene_type:complete